MARKKEKMAPKIAKGAAAVSIAAGVVAAGAALSDEETRESLKKGAQKTAENLKEVASGFQESPEKGYQAVTHKVNKGKNKLSHTKTGRKAKQLKDKFQD